MNISADSAVILTYPGHLLSTAVCLRYLRDNYQCPETIYVIIDDIGTGSDPHYFRWARYLYQHYQVTLIAMSEFDVNDIETGWIRQQLVKLSLDQVLSGQRWLCVDGDTLVSAPLDQPHIPVRPVSASVPNPSACQALDDRFRQYVEDCGLDYFGSDHWPRAVRTNAIPVRWIDRDSLISLRDWVSEHTGQPWDELHHDWFAGNRSVIEQGPRLMTEFELLENYRRQVLRQQWPLVDYQMRHFGVHWPRGIPWVGTFWGNDHDIKEQVWIAHGISESDIRSAKIFTKALT